MTLAALFLAACGDDTQPDPAPETIASAGVDLPLPPEVEFQPKCASWDADEAIDPLLVKDINVMDPAREKYIEELKATWKDEAFIAECRRLLELNDESKTEEYEAGLQVLNEKYYKNAGLWIARVWHDEDGRARIEFAGSTGARLTLPIDD